MPRQKYRRKNADQELLFFVLLAVLLVSAVLAGPNGSWSAHTIVALIVGAGLFGVLVLGYAFYLEDKRRRALRLLDLAQVDKMFGLEFERWVGEQLRGRGYHIMFTPINDYGVDIVARKDGVRTAVQVKRYHRILDQKPIREAVAGMMHYKCSQSMVVTSSSFTKAAEVLARSNHCELIDRNKLAEWLAEAQAS